MVYTMQYDSPIGKIFLGADKIGLTGLWFYGEKNFADNRPKKIVREKLLLWSRPKSGSTFISAEKSRISLRRSTL